jgi:hypothetical protein
MTVTVARLGVLLLLGLVAWLLVWGGRRFVEAQRRQALASGPLSAIPVLADTARVAAATNSSLVRILAFRSDDCQQCHRLQAPALRRVVAAHGDAVAVVEVDATREHNLVQTYRVLTVPSTVVLDATGKPHAINYGFANTQRLLEQVEGVLAKADSDIIHCGVGS